MSSARLAIISWAPYPILAMLLLRGQECFLAENCSPPWYQRHLLLNYSQVKLLLSLDDAYMNFSAVKLFSCLHKQKLPKSLLLARRMSITSETILKGCVRYTKTSSSHQQPSHLKSFVINSSFDTVFENHFENHLIFSVNFSSIEMNAITNGEMTPLKIACKNGHQEVVQLLLNLSKLKY